VKFVAFLLLVIAAELPALQCLNRSEVDVFACPRRGLKMRMLAVIDAPDAIREIRACFGLPKRAPPVAPALPDSDEAVFW